VAPAPSYGRGWDVLDVEHLPEWTRGRLQRMDAIDAVADPAAATAESTATRKTLPTSTIDLEYRSGDSEDITAWLSLPGRAIGAELIFTFGATVCPARIRLHNGWNNVLDPLEYKQHGRLARATIRAGSRSLDVGHDDTPDKVTIDCDFGVTEHVVLRITAVHPGSSLVAAHA
jgi:hypothetical protein